MHVFDLTSNSNIAISAISITPTQTILSGGWVFSKESTALINNVLSGSLAISLSDQAFEFLERSKIEYRQLKISDFLESAKNEVEIALSLFEAHKQNELNKRKKLITPSFFEWPIEIDLNKATEQLEHFGLVTHIQGTDPEMEKVLTAARLIKFLIEKWKSDEVSRQVRKYIDGVDAEVTLLPKSWLN